MEKEVLKALTGSLGLAGKLVGRSVDEVAKAVKKSDDPVDLWETGLYHLASPAGSPLAPRARWQEVQSASRLNASMLKKLTMSAGEKEFVEGLKFMVSGRIPQALESLRDAARRSESKVQVTDAYFVLGSLLLSEGQSEEASRHFHTALMAQQGLGRGLKRWCPSFHLALPLTDFSGFALGPDLIGLTIALSLSQFHRDPGEAVHTLEQLLELVPGEPTATFFIAIFRFKLGLDRDVFLGLQKLLPDSNLHLACLLLLGLACARLGDTSTARELFKKALQQQELDQQLQNDLRVALAHVARMAGSAQEADQELQTVLRKTPQYCSFETRWGLQLTPAPAVVEEVKPAEPPPPAAVAPSPAPTPAAPPTPITLADAGGSATRLVCTEKGLEIELKRAPFTLGREADVSLANDGAASRQHAHVSYADGDYWIEDLGSTNGTFVNRHRIRRRVELHRGDIVEIGEHRFEVR